MDLGECPKIHDLALRADYETAQKKKDYYYDVEVSFSYNSSYFSINIIFTRFIKIGYGAFTSIYC